MTSKKQVISEKRVPSVYSSLDTLKRRVVLWHEAPEITEDEIYSLMVKPEHIDTLNEAIRVCGPIQTHSSYTTNVKVPEQDKTTELRIMFAPAISRLIPNYATRGFRKDADPELMAKIQAWCDRRYLIGKDFAHVKLVFDMLNKKCNSVKQMSAYFEGIIPIMDSHDDLKHIANKIREAKQGSLISTTREFRVACQRATQIMVSAMLLPEAAPEQKPITFGFFNSNLGYTKFDFSDLTRPVV